MSVLSLLEEVIPILPIVDLIGAYLFTPEFPKLYFNMEPETQEYYRTLLQSYLLKHPGCFFREGYFPPESNQMGVYPITPTDTYTDQLQLCCLYLRLYSDCPLRGTSLSLAADVKSLFQMDRSSGSPVDKFLQVYLNGKLWLPPSLEARLRYTERRDYLEAYCDIFREVIQRSQYLVDFLGQGLDLLREGKNPQDFLDPQANYFWIHANKSEAWYLQEIEKERSVVTEHQKFLCHYLEALRMLRYPLQGITLMDPHQNLTWIETLNSGIMSVALLIEERITPEGPLKFTGPLTAPYTRSILQEPLSLCFPLAFPANPIYHQRVYQALHRLEGDRLLEGKAILQLRSLYYRGLASLANSFPLAPYLLVNSQVKCHLNFIFNYLHGSSEVQKDRAIQILKRCHQCLWCDTSLDCYNCKGTGICRHCDVLPPERSQPCSACCDTGVCALRELCEACKYGPVCGYCLKTHAPYEKRVLLEDLGSYREFFEELVRKLTA